MSKSASFGRSRRTQTWPSEWSKFRHKPADYMYAGFFEEPVKPVARRIDRMTDAPAPDTQVLEAPPGSDELEEFDAIALSETTPRKFFDVYRLMSSLTGGLVITSVIMLSGAVAFLYRAKLMSNIVEGDGVKVGQLSTADSTIGGLANASFVAGIVLCFLFIIWQFTYAHNAQVLRGRVFLDERWALLGWVVPFVLPGLQLWGSAKASDPELPIGASPKRGRAPIIIPIWAFTMALGSVLYLQSTRNRPTGPGDIALAPPELVAKFVSADQSAFMSLIVFSVGMILTLTLLRRLSHDQSAVMVLLGETPDYSAAWTVSGDEVKSKSGSIRFKSTKVNESKTPGASGPAAQSPIKEDQVKYVRANRR